MERKLHHYWVRYNGLTFRSLPLGRRSAKVPEAEIGFVVGMITHLGIDYDCARGEIPQLPKRSTPPPN